MKTCSTNVFFDANEYDFGFMLVEEGFRSRIFDSFFFVSFFFHFIECVCCVGCCSCIFLIFQLKHKKFAIKYQKYCCSFYCFICVRSQLFFICLNMFEDYTNFDMKNKNKSIRIQNCKMYNNKRIKTETPTTHFVGIA